jgi:hypothetical protein
MATTPKETKGLDMTRKDYVLIAKEINLALQEAGTDENKINLVKKLAVNFCETLKIANASFDKSRFLQACGF